MKNFVIKSFLIFAFFVASTLWLSILLEGHIGQEKDIKLDIDLNSNRPFSHSTTYGNGRDVVMPVGNCVYFFRMDNREYDNGVSEPILRYLTKECE